MMLRSALSKARSSAVLAAVTIGCVACQAPIGVDRDVIRSLQPTTVALQRQLAATPTFAPPSLTPLVTPMPRATVPPSSLLVPPPPPAVGQPLTVTTESNDRATVTVNSLRDRFPSASQYNQPKGRWVLLDWSVTNAGSTTFNVSPYNFKLQTADGFVFSKGNHGGMPAPEMFGSKIGPGQTVRGYIAYDVPVAAVLKSAIYQPLASPQFIVAALTP